MTAKSSVMMMMMSAVSISALSAFIAWLAERERSNFRFFIRNFHQRVTSQRTVNANE